MQTVNIEFPPLEQIIAKVSILSSPNACTSEEARP